MSIKDQQFGAMVQAIKELTKSFDLLKEELPERYAPIWVKYPVIAIIGGFGTLIITAIGLLIFKDTALALLAYL